MIYTQKYLVTGNETVSLPTIRQSDAALEGISILYMAAKGMLEICGSDYLPLLRPFVAVDKVKHFLKDIQWDRINYWIPTFTATAGEVKVKGLIFAPVGERGFCYKLEIINQSDDKLSIDFGLEGCWAKTIHSINESKLIKGEVNAYSSGWNHAFVMDMRVGVSLFAFAPIYTEQPEKTATQYEYSQEAEGTVTYKLHRKCDLISGTSVSENFWFGLGFEEVAAATSAKEMLRQGFEAEYEKTCDWLKKRMRKASNERLTELLNLNMFFSFFFGCGITLDTQELVLVTSRSPRYYVSAAYWDRDSLLWCFPAILMADKEFAKDMFEYVFGRQGKNLGIHSRFIDGTVLEPGFELDELCAPIIALASYIDETGDTDILQRTDIVIGIERILKILKSKKHNQVTLFETMLQPTDDMHVYKYITYDNVLVWKILNDLARLHDKLWSKEKCDELKETAKQVMQAINEHCIKVKDEKEMFAWSVDLQGNWDIYDEPPGSLLLLPHYGFCEMDNIVWKNTVEIIRRKDYPYSFADCPIAEIGCPHAPHPWLLSIANSLLSGNKESAEKHLLLCKMDNGIACESVDEYTGESATGDAFATCAGFVAFAIDKAFGVKEEGV